METPQPVLQPKRSIPGSIVHFLKSYWIDYLILLLMAGLIIAFDQWTKVWVRAHIQLGSDWLPSSMAWLMPYARLRYWFNSGAAFGMFKNGNPIFMTLAVIVACAILYYLPRTARRDWWLRLALALQFSGAVGNLIDRIQFGHVTDFISVGNFAIFNVADSSISVGVVILILGVWITEAAEKRRIAVTAPQAPVPGSAEDKRG
jgi:signal peptidase II